MVWAIVLLGLFAASVGAQALFTVGLTDRLTEQLQASAAARGALQYVLLTLEEDESRTVDGLSENWANASQRLQAHPLGGTTFEVLAPDSGPIPRYGLTDEDRFLNLNTAPGPVLERFFYLTGGLSEDEAGRVAAAIEDWRDEDDRERQQGAEGNYYRASGPGYDCKNGPFENLEELLLIRGVTPAVYQQAAPHLTVYGDGRLNLNTADPAALHALGLSPAGVEGLVLFRSGEDSLEGNWDDRRLVSTAGLLDGELRAFVPVDDLALLSRWVGEDVLGVGATAFRLQVRVATPKMPQAAQARCVLDRQGAILLWTEQ